MNEIFKIDVKVFLDTKYEYLKNSNLEFFMPSSLINLTTGNNELGIFYIENGYLKIYFFNDIYFRNIDYLNEIQKLSNQKIDCNLDMFIFADDDYVIYILNNVYFFDKNRDENYNQNIIDDYLCKKNLILLERSL